MRKRALVALASALGASPMACKEAPKDHGEALVVVSTDVSVPRFVNRVRIDVYSTEGQRLESRDVLTPGTADWPVSFSIFRPTDEGERTVLLRLRGYHDGHVRDARGERFESGDTPWVEPRTYGSLDELCENPPPMELGTPLVVRRGREPITTFQPQTNADGSVACDRENRAGSAAGRLVIATAGRYRIDVVSSTPNGARAEPGGSVMLALRRDCRVPSTQVGCASHISQSNHHAQLVVDLTPGTYTLVTGGEEHAPADLTLRAAPEDAARVVEAPDAGATEDAGVDVLRTEPVPGATIDRLVAVRLVPGVRGTVRVALAGECFGTMADLVGRKSCVDTAGARADLPQLLPVAPVDRTGPQPRGTWAGEQPIACTLQPRSGGLDPEACVPGGAFVLGDTLALGDLASHPQRVRVVEPFLLDVHEVTVARYRAAVAAGFVAPDASPTPNASKDGSCTWSVGPTPAVPAPGVDRETLPLTCVTWYTARAVCKFLGGDLPTEDQWEYAATAAGRTQETAYPWGDAFPDCARAAIGRVRTGIVSLDTCAADNTAPVVAVDALPWSAGDVTPQGIAGLAGNVHEWLVDGLLPYDHPAWTSAGLRRPFVVEKEAPLRAARGSDWAGLVATATGSTRRAEPPISTYDNVGFRCARSAR